MTICWWSVELKHAKLGDEDMIGMKKLWGQFAEKKGYHHDGERVLSLQKCEVPT